MSEWAKLEKRLRHPDPGVRRRVLGEFIAHEGAEAVPALIGALGDRDWRVRSFVASALGELAEGAPEVASALLEALRSDGSPDVRETAALSLSEAAPQDPRTAPALIDALADEDYDVRESAAGAMRVVAPGDARAVPSLIRILRSPEIFMEACAAAWALAGSDTREAESALCSSLRDADDYSVRAACACALGESASDTAKEALRRALGDEEAPVRAAAAKALGESISDSEALVDELIAMVSEVDEDRVVREGVSTSLGRSDHSRAVAALMRMLCSDRAWEVRRACVAGLAGKQEHDGVREALERATQDENPLVRQDATEALNERGQRSDV